MMAKRKREQGRSLVKPTPPASRPKRKTWPNADDNPFDEAKAKSRRTRQRRAALLRERRKRRAALRRARNRIAQKAAEKRKAKAKPKEAFTFETVFGQ